MRLLESRRARWSAAAVASLALAGVTLRVRSSESASLERVEPAASVAASRPHVTLHVPRALGAIELDGDLEEEDWTARSARTGAFRAADGTEGRPFSDARLLWKNDVLYVALYAADEDIRATQTQPDSPLWLEDAFHMSFGAGDAERWIDVAPNGSVTDARRRGGKMDYAWSAGVLLGRDVDGTVNDASDQDEEWIIEMAIPLASIGLRGEPGARAEFSVRRCDRPKAGGRACATWGGGAMRGELVLD